MGYAVASRSISRSPSKAAEPSVPSPGACSNGCWTSSNLRIRTVSGTSAGAMNGAMLVEGLARGGPDEARACWTTFWQRGSITSGSVSGPSAGWLARFSAPMFNAVQKAGTALARPGPRVHLQSPSRHSLGTAAAALEQPGAPELVVAATRVRTGEARLFRAWEIRVDTLLASACLPLIFPAVRDRRRGVLGRRLQQQPARASADRSRRSARRAHRANCAPPNASLPPHGAPQ